MIRPRPKFGVIAIAVYLVATPAAAAEITHTRKADGSHVVTISGQIRHGDGMKFFELTWAVPDPATVILNSPGGWIGEAMAIGGLVRSRNYETRVENGAVCNSACTLIWLAGTSRHLDSRARLGFHSAATTLRPPFKRSEPGNRTAALYMAGLGVPQKLIDLQPKADPCCLNYVDHARAKAWGLLSDRPAKQLALRTPETQQPAATAPASLKLMPVVRPVVVRSAQPAAANDVINARGYWRGLIDRNSNEPIPNVLAYAAQPTPIAAARAVPLALGTPRIIAVKRSDEPTPATLQQLPTATAPRPVTTSREPVQQQQALPTLGTPQPAAPPAALADSKGPPNVSPDRMPNGAFLPPTTILPADWVKQVERNWKSAAPRPTPAPMPTLVGVAPAAKRLPNVIPPEQYDHPYTGLIIVQRLKTEGMMREVCPDTADQVWLGCAYRLKHACLIMLADEAVIRAYGLTGDMLFRHEMGHCNGWVATHVGARTYWDAKMMPASDMPELIDVESFTIDPVNRSYMWPP